MVTHHAVTCEGPKPQTRDVIVGVRLEPAPLFCKQDAVHIVRNHYAVT